LSLWNVDKKRPVDTVELAHGHTTGASLPRGIASIDALAGSDVAVTGSSDGYARFWNVKTDDYDNNERGLESLGRIPLHGFINDLALGPRARFCVAAIGQEPRLGRWERIAKSKNRFAIVRLRKEDDDDVFEEEDGIDVSEEGVAVDGGEGSSNEEGQSSFEDDDDDVSSGEE
jgi:ribosomal RNA-processing protein 9